MNHRIKRLEIRLLMQLKTIFILDQNLTRSNFLAYHLKGGGFKQVRSFSSMDDCLYTIQSGLHPDFILLNHGASFDSSLQFLKKVSSINPYVRLIVFSDHGSESIAHEFLREGAIDYILFQGDRQKYFDELVANLKYLVKSPV